MGKTITKYGKEFINHFDRKYLSACCHQQRGGLATFPTAVKGSNTSKCPKQLLNTFLENEVLTARVPGCCGWAFVTWELLCHGVIYIHSGAA